MLLTLLCASEASCLDSVEPEANGLICPTDASMGAEALVTARGLPVLEIAGETADVAVPPEMVV